ncbi:MAG: hypothetical protein ACI9XO_004977 [Paraglaciecola sp.]|jgi:hypothetical protein
MIFSRIFAEDNLFYHKPSEQNQYLILNIFLTIDC